MKESIKPDSKRDTETLVTIEKPIKEMISGKNHTDSEPCPDPSTSPHIQGLPPVRKAFYSQPKDMRIHSTKPKIPPLPFNLIEPDCPNPFQKDVNIPATITELLPGTEDMAFPLLRFDISQAAAAHNWSLLQSSGMIWNEVLETRERSITSLGSEFKSVEKLETLFRLHPRWF